MAIFPSKKTTTHPPFVRIQTEGKKMIYIAVSQSIVLKFQKSGQAWFAPEEIRHLKGKSRESLELVIDVKEVFPKSTVVDPVLLF